MLNLEKLKIWTKWLKPILPPILTQMASGLAPRIVWEGDYLSWIEAEKNSGGYAAQEILIKVQNSVLAVLAGKAAFERDGVAFTHADPNFTLLASLYQAIEKHDEIAIIDFGGSLGSTFLQSRPWLSKGLSSWMVVEQPSFVEAGKKLYRDINIQFTSSLSEARKWAENRAIFLHTAAVLQYLNDPVVELRMLIEELDPEWIYLDRVPYICGSKSRLTVQRVPPSICSASYPCWFFSRDLFETVLSSSHEKVFTFAASDRCIDFQATFEGSFWRRKINGRS
ncbi:MAG: methyltransferase, TIGR04325 family [Proteobacteria bacterium]|nr:MAG: methyltransferase, TIGR04325 family [Pseudomonadota bacterium]